MRLPRWLSRRDPAISREAAIAIARDECDRLGLPWLEPVSVHRRYGNWAVWTHAGSRGGNVRVLVDKANGAILGVYGPISR